VKFNSNIEFVGEWNTRMPNILKSGVN